MSSTSPVPDLLIVGGLTIDRFADGRTAPGGSVIHASRALAASHTLEILTIAGDEPIAQSGLAELRMLARHVVCQTARRTITFRHQHSPTGRRMWLEAGNGRIGPEPAQAGALSARAVLFAPVADEIELEAVSAWQAAPTRAAILQGWLRVVDDDREVQATSLTGLNLALCSALSAMELLVASGEDLRADGSDPRQLLGLLRERFGPGPVLVLTKGERGLWVDRMGDRWHESVPRVVEGVPTVGAGDVLAAALAARIGRDDSTQRLREHVNAAVHIVAETLDTRRPDRRS